MFQNSYQFENIYTIKGNNIYEGKFSIIFDVNSLQNENYVLKLYKTWVPFDLFLNELENCRNLCWEQNPDFIRYISSSEEDNIFGENYILFEKAQKGSLDEYLTNISLEFPEIEKKVIFCKIAEMVERLHLLHYCHGNICFQNIFVNQQYQLRLGDFGSAKTFYLQNNISERAQKDDIKSLGILLLYLITGKQNFENKENFWSLLKLNKKELILEQNFIELIESMLDNNYQNRPDFNTIYNSHYFDDIRNQNAFYATEIALQNRFREIDEFLHSENFDNLIHS